MATILQASATISAGKIKRGELEVEAKQEELAAISRERDRKSNLADALASQNAAAGARGIAAFEGSPLTILQEDIRREEVATSRDFFQSQLASATARSRGLIAETGAKGQAGLDLIRQAVEAAGK